MADVKVNKELLKWARKLRNFTLAQAAGQIGVNYKELQKYELGLKLPTTKIFRKIAKVYAIPEATLFLNMPPRQAPKDLKDFRTRTIAGIMPEIGPETNIIISRIRAFQRKFSDLRDKGYDYSMAALPRVNRASDPTIAGETERARIGISLADQLGWNDAYDAFRKWRRLIEDQGVCVYIDKFPIDDCRGVSILDDPQFPAILLNKTEPAKDVAWIFSLIHEYAHILIEMPGISDRNFENVTEAFCNRFAAGFLMPLEYLKEIIKPWPSGSINWRDEQIIDFARQFKVSQQAMALRLESIGIAPVGFFDSFKERQPKRVRQRPVGFPPPVTQRLYNLGRRFPTTIFYAMDNGAISQVETTQILNANLALLSKMRARLGV